MKLKSSMKTTPILLLAILASFAASGQAANIPLQTPVSTVPVVITKPGHYYLVGNLFFTLPTPTSPPTAITVNAPGPVVIDMRGFTLSGGGMVDFPADNYFTVDPTGILIQSSNVTVLNGTIHGFWNGVTANATAAGYPTVYLSGIDIEGITFSQADNDGTYLNHVNNSVVRNCQFIENYAGMTDSGSTTGNTYVNDKVVDSMNPAWSFEILAPDTVNYTYTAIPSVSK
jgi:hypothetical protein